MKKFKCTKRQVIDSVLYGIGVGAATFSSEIIICSSPNYPMPGAALAILGAVSLVGTAYGASIPFSHDDYKKKLTRKKTR